MTYVFDCQDRHDLPAAEVVALLGGKAANLAVMAAELELPVPPAFTISTRACNAYLADGWPPELDEQVRHHVAEMERRLGRRFGDPEHPLLVSVRSGAPVSMPGMMDTILNLGLNDATTAGLAQTSGSPAFAADCRRRFEEMYRGIVGVEDVPSDPWRQLREAVEAVFRSWNSERARAYRQREGIPDDLGTAVTVQAMVFGNLDERSGSGVLFTRDPSTGERTLYGDVMFEAQGEDVVAGTHRTATLDDLAQRLPEVARQLADHARRLERHNADMCDIEFTIERGTLWLLQCRIGKRTPQAALRIAVEMAEDPDFPLSREQAVERVAHLLADVPVTVSADSRAAPPIAVGLPASPGLASGVLVTSSEAAIAMADAGRRVILARAETSPDDVPGMARAAGLLTSHGGLASHAAVVARGWGIPAVVGAAAVGVDAAGIAVNGRRIQAGSELSIDGSTGAVFEGVVTGTTVPSPHAATLVAWARELGVEIPADREDGAAPASGTDADDAPPADRDGVITTLGVKGHAILDWVAESLFTTGPELRPLLDELIEAGLVEEANGMLRLTADGRGAASALAAEIRERVGTDGEELLASFHALDVRMKEVVTAWQLRDADGEQVVNDHSDAAHDADVLTRLSRLHDDARAWLAPLAETEMRFRRYRSRLDRAARLAAAGDHRYLASPRVDSYHSAWFELHEELIGLAGRTREEEVAAGRA